MSSDSPPGILFLCVANSARSQLAEALARHRFGARARDTLAALLPRLDALVDGEGRS